MKIDFNQIFLVDATGAFISALLLGIVLPVIQPYIGMPIAALYTLAIFPAILLFYSVVCHLFTDRKRGYLLRMLAVANLSYCGISLWFIILYYKELTLLGWLYFIIEMIIIISLIWVELSLANKASKYYRLSS